MSCHAGSLVAVLALAVIGCGAATPALPIAQNEFGQFSLQMNDQSGLVDAVRPVEPDSVGPHGAVAMPEPKEIEIRWLGGACAHVSVLNVTGSAQDLSVEVRTPNDPQLLPFLPVSCPAVGVPMGVVLSLSEPVAANAIDFEAPF